MEEIIELEKQIEETNRHIEELKKQVEELKEIAKQDKKEHKSLSDYRVYEKLKDGEKYKTFDKYNEIMEEIWSSADLNIAQFKIGNVYSIDTPNELLEREIKKRQLWFALEKHLKEKGCLATSEDFKFCDMKKYFIVYDFSTNTLVIEINFTYKSKTIYSTDFEVLKNYMDTLSEEDIRIMFDVD